LFSLYPGAVSFILKGTIRIVNGHNNVYLNKYNFILGQLWSIDRIIRLIHSKSDSLVLPW
jgi:hypothetical protein